MVTEIAPSVEEFDAAFARGRGGLMAVTVKLPTQLRDAAGGAAPTAVEGSTVGEALEALYAEHGELRGRLSDDGGGLRRFVNVFSAARTSASSTGSTRRSPTATRSRSCRAVAGGASEVVGAHQVQLQRRPEAGGQRLHVLGHGALVGGDDLVPPGRLAAVQLGHVLA